MAFYDAKYKNEVFNRPQQSINPKQKNKEWCISNARYIYAYGIKNNETVFYSKRDKFEKLRAYAEGRQSINQYMDRFKDVTSSSSTTQSEIDNGYNEQSTESARLGLHNIDFTIVPLWNKFELNLLGRFQSVDYDVQVDAIDEMSGIEKEQKKWLSWTKVKFKDVIRESNETLGVSEENKGEYVPETFQELELFSQLGGYKLNKEIVCEQLLKHTFDISYWETDLKDKIFLDFIRLNCAAVKDYCDPVSNKLKARYVDPSSLIAQYSKEYDYRNSEFVAEQVIYTVSDLRDYGYTEEFLAGLALKFEDMFGNPGRWDWTTYRPGNSLDYPYNNYKVPVLECEWISHDDYYYTKRKINDKVERTYQEEFDKGLKRSKAYENRDDRKTDRISVKVIYKCSWIIDTDEAFDYGLQNDIPRPNAKEANLSYHIYSLPGKSMVEASITDIDQYHMAWYKFQNEFAKSAPAGLAIEWDSISGIALGGKSVTPYQVLKLRQIHGDLVYRATTSGITGMPGNNQGRLITPLPSEVIGVIQSYLPVFDFHLSNIQSKTGIPASADASTPDPNMPVRTSEMAIAGMLNRIKPTFNGYLRLKERVANNLMLRIQVKCKFDKDYIEAYSRVIGDKIDIFKFANDISNSEIGIRMIARPNDQEKAEIEQQLQIAMQSGKNGVPTLDASGYFLVKRIMMNSGSMKLAQLMLAYLSNKEQQRQNEQAQRMVQLQNEEQMKRDQFVSQLAMQKLQADVEAEITKQNTINQLKYDLELRNQLEIIKAKSGAEAIRQIGEGVMKTTLNAQDNDIKSMEEETILSENKENMPV